jgi:hypothetical protein
MIFAWATLARRSQLGRPENRSPRFPSDHDLFVACQLLVKVAVVGVFTRYLANSKILIRTASGVLLWETPLIAMVGPIYLTR